MKPSDLVAHFGSPVKAAKSIGVHRRTVYHWITERKIPHKTQRLIEFETGGALKASKK